MIAHNGSLVRAVLMTIAVTLGAPVSAAAHARLVRAIPSDGAELSSGPATVDMWFTELLDVGFNTVAIFPAAEISAPHPESHTSGAARVDRADGTHLECPVAPLAPGEWIVQWRVLSRDGHPAWGRTTFRIRAPD